MSLSVGMMTLLKRDWDLLQDSKIAWSWRHQDDQRHSHHSPECLLYLTGSSKLYKKETYLLKDNKLLRLVPIALLLIALLSLPYYYYQLMRWCICGCAAYLAYQHYKEKGGGFRRVTRSEANAIRFTIIFIVIAIVYNPIAPIHLSREEWVVINIITMFIFLCGWVRSGKNK